MFHDTISKNCTLISIHVFSLTKSFPRFPTFSSPLSLGFVATSSQPSFIPYPSPIVFQSLKSLVLNRSCMFQHLLPLQVPVKDSKCSLCLSQSTKIDQNVSFPPMYFINNCLIIIIIHVCTECILMTVLSSSKGFCLIALSQCLLQLVE